MGRLAMGLVGALIVAAITVSLGQSQPPAEPSERKLEPQPAGDVQTPRELQRDDDRREVVSEEEHDVDAPGAHGQ